MICQPSFFYFFRCNLKNFCIFTQNLMIMAKKSKIFLYKISIIFLMIAATLAAFWLLKPKHLEVKIMCYNVQHCAGMDKAIDYDRTAEVIIRQQPDVVAIQELDSVTGRSSRKYQLGELNLIYSGFWESHQL